MFKLDAKNHPILKEELKIIEMVIDGNPYAYVLLFWEKKNLILKISHCKNIFLNFYIL